MRQLSMNLIKSRMSKLMNKIREKAHLMKIKRNQNKTKTHK